MTNFDYHNKNNLEDFFKITSAMHTATTQPIQSPLLSATPQSNYSPQKPKGGSSGIKKVHKFVHARVLNPVYCGMMVKEVPRALRDSGPSHPHHQAQQQPSPNDLTFLPLNQIKIDVTILESIALIRTE